MAVLLVAFHDAVGEAQGERGIRIAGRTQQGVAGPGDRGVGLLLSLRLFLRYFPQGPRLGVHQACEFNHGVAGR